MVRVIVSAVVFHPISMQSSPDRACGLESYSEQRNDRHPPDIIALLGNSGFAGLSTATKQIREYNPAKKLPATDPLLPAAIKERL